MSHFVVSARKYRPVRFDDVVGQKHVTGTLKNALQQDKLAHAFLFCGPRGVGKTTCARILAKALNCQNLSADKEPCNACPSCEALNQNASFNIIELDAASNNSVDQMRTLIEQVRFQPQQGRFKVFIIDEVHMLSQAAFNAFLKTLEEPPPYAVFILATTEKHKIIPTILSRCQIFDFRRIQVPDIMQHLEGICDKEGIKADREALHIIAQKADGALRDALSIFDRVASFSGDAIRYETVIENLNVLDHDYYFRVVDALLTENLPSVLITLDEVMRKGFDPDLFINGLAGHLRQLLICQDAETLPLLEASEALRKRYREQSSLASPGFLLTALNIANDCDVEYRHARNKRLHVEMALIKMTYIQRARQPVAPTPEPKPAPATEEKKTPPSSVKPETQAETGEKENDLDPKKSENPAQTEKAKEPSAKKVEPSVAPTPAEKPKKSKHGIATLQNLDSIATHIRKKDEERAKRRVDCTLDRVKEYWMAYADRLDQEIVKAVLKETRLKLKGKTIHAHVGSALSKNTLQQETALMDYLRTAFHTTDLELRVKVDSAMAREKKAPAPKRLNRKEKFEKMMETNPLIREACRRFDLTVDESE